MCPPTYTQVSDSNRYELRRDVCHSVPWCMYLYRTTERKGLGANCAGD